MEAQAYQADWWQAEQVLERRAFCEELCKKFEIGIYDDNDLLALRRELIGDDHAQDHQSR